MDTRAEAASQATADHQRRFTAPSQLIEKINSHIRKIEEDKNKNHWQYAWQTMKKLAEEIADEFSNDIVGTSHDGQSFPPGDNIFEYLYKLDAKIKYLLPQPDIHDEARLKKLFLKELKEIIDSGYINGWNPCSTNTPKINNIQYTNFYRANYTPSKLIYYHSGFTSLPILALKKSRKAFLSNDEAKSYMIKARTLFLEIKNRGNKAKKDIINYLKKLYFLADKLECKLINNHFGNQNAIVFPYHRINEIRNFKSHIYEELLKTKGNKIINHNSADPIESAFVELHKMKLLSDARGHAIELYNIQHEKHKKYIEENRQNNGAVPTNEDAKADEWEKPTRVRRLIQAAQLLKSSTYENNDDDDNIDPSPKLGEILSVSLDVLSKLSVENSHFFFYQTYGTRTAKCAKNMLNTVANRNHNHEIIMSDKKKEEICIRNDDVEYKTASVRLRDALNRINTYITGNARKQITIIEIELEQKSLKSYVVIDCRKPNNQDRPAQLYLLYSPNNHAADIKEKLEHEIAIQSNKSNNRININSEVKCIKLDKDQTTKQDAIKRFNLHTNLYGKITMSKTKSLFYSTPELNSFETLLKIGGIYALNAVIFVIAVALILPIPIIAATNKYKERNTPDIDSSEMENIERHLTLS